MKRCPHPAAILALAAALCGTDAVARQACGTAGVTMSVAPNPAPMGAPITFTVTNGSAQPIQFPSSSAISGIFDGSCAGPKVYSGYASPFEPIIPPGSSLSATWDQSDLFGGAVVPGIYAARIRYYQNLTSLQECCLTVQVISPCAFPPLPYGTAEVVPGLPSPYLGCKGGPPSTGNSGFQLVISTAPPVAPALLLLGAGAAALPSNFGTLYVDPALPLLPLSFVLGGFPGIKTSGSLLIAAPVPADPTLVGVIVYLQALIADTTSSGGYVHTRGLALTICP